ncbi:MAG: hypothetical protein IMZ53_02965 [Thermoplasmata archaeon]|nr:hypothetical protein [Thermoplasmata archaeon]
MRAERIKDQDLVRIKDVPKIVLELTGLVRQRICCYQWINEGRRAYDGSLIHLKTTKRNGYMYTTRQWVEDFIRLQGRPTITGEQNERTH